MVAFAVVVLDDRAFEVRREFAPYIGVSWGGLFGKTADYAEAAGGESSETALVVGIHAWF